MGVDVRPSLLFLALPAGIPLFAANTFTDQFMSKDGHPSIMAFPEPNDPACA